MPNDDFRRQQSQDELLHSTAVLQALPDGVVICDRAGIVRFINPAGARLLGVDIDRWLNRPLADLPHGAALSQSVVGQTAKICVDGEWLSYRVMPVWSSNHPSQQLGRVVMFDERPSQQEASRYLLAVLSHELRAPLTSIIGFTDSLTNPLFSWHRHEPDDREEVSRAVRR